MFPPALPSAILVSDLHIRSDNPSIEQITVETK